MNDEPRRRTEPADLSEWESLARYFAGESPAEESEQVRTWLDAHPSDKALFEQLSSVELTAEPADVESALARVHARMEHPAVAPRLTIARGRRGRRGGATARTWRRLAIALPLAAAAGLVLLVEQGRQHSASLAASTPRTYSTLTGHCDTILLSDGSRVILGPNSRLAVPAGFGERARAVELEGDAYFDVHHDDRVPFVVRVANAMVEDIGTTFTVESDAGDTTSVSVLSGSVRLRAAGEPAAPGAILAAGDRGSLSKDGQVHAYRRTVREDDAAWTQGRIVLRDASLTRIAGEIRRWYGVELTVADSALLRRHVTTTFDEQDPIDQVLKSLALTLGARVERRGTSATISLEHGAAMAR